MIIEQLQGARRAWALLCASATADPDRRHLIASLRSFLPAEFIADLLDRQLGRESHGLFGLLALCAAEVAAIYAYWLMESTGQPAFAAPGGTARSESFRPSPSDGASDAAASQSTTSGGGKPRRTTRLGRRRSVPDLPDYSRSEQAEEMTLVVSLDGARENSPGGSQLPTRIPIRGRGDSGGSSASGVSASPLIGGVSRPESLSTPPNQPRRGAAGGLEVLHRCRARRLLTPQQAPTYCASVHRAPQWARCCSRHYNQCHLLEVL